MRIRQLAAAAVLSLTPAGPAAAAGPVPPAWTVFAGQVAQSLQDRLADPSDPAAARLHDFLDAQAAGPARAPPVVQLWFKPNGAVARAVLPSLGDAQADADLRAVLESPQPEPPPPSGMRQPLVLRLRLATPD